MREQTAVGTTQGIVEESKVKFLTITAMGIALVYVFTAFINVRLPIAAAGGLIHLGNVPLFIFAIIFGKKTGAIAGGIGILLVMLFMILIYRLPGVVASIALVAYTAVTGIILVLFRINLSLPGIAGIILSIGMAVDANVVIFERIKEELRNGKSTAAATKSGFKRAFTAVFDSNITTVIASGVLWYFGTGTVQGFAITLFIGVLLSMLSAIVVTRIFLNALIGLNIRNPKLYGA